MTPARPVGHFTKKYLRRCGYTENQISTWSNETRLLHDLSLCGDDILDELEILRRDFGVNLTKLEFDKYFPRELSNDAFVIAIRRLLQVLGLGRIVDKVLDKYEPVTLGMIEATIANKYWDDNLITGPSI